MANANQVAAQLTQRQIAKTIDKLAALRALVKPHNDEISELEELLKAQGEGLYESKSYTYNVLTTYSMVVSLKRAKEVMTPAQLIAATVQQTKTIGTLRAKV